MKKLKIAFSTCPNDTFIFYAIIKNKINHDLNISYHLADIDELNTFAFQYSFDIIKLSFNAYGFLRDKYYLLDSGSALGKGCGPLLISKKNSLLENLKNKKVGIPGKYTTANFLFDLATNNSVKNKIYLRFDEIIPAILNDKIDAGVIIHESRFTYESFGLKALLDLGEWWEDKYNAPIPLGGIAIKKDFSRKFILKFDNLLKQSIKYAYKNFDEAMNFIKIYSKEMEENVIKAHINLYVNNYTYSLGKDGQNAIIKMYELGGKKNIFPNINTKIFI